MMFENLRSAFREAVENFRTELHREDVPDAVRGLLTRMRDEVAEEKVRLRAVEDQIRQAVDEARREGREEATAERRRRMAERIGDEETAEVARRFAERHRRRRELLERKAATLSDELALGRAEVEEMLARIEEARARGDELAATRGRADARASVRAAADLFEELDRMAERVSGEEARAAAAESFGPADLGGEPSPPPPSEGGEGGRAAADVDRRLAELKRRMGQD